jgi:hypothetical protein
MLQSVTSGVFLYRKMITMQEDRGYGRAQVKKINLRSIKSNDDIK